MEFWKVHNYFYKKFFPHEVVNIFVPASITISWNRETTVTIYRFHHIMYVMLIDFRYTMVKFEEKIQKNMFFFKNIFQEYILENCKSSTTTGSKRKRRHRISDKNSWRNRREVTVAETGDKDEHWAGRKRLKPERSGELGVELERGDEQILIS